jgi:hypothetical protein
VASSTAATQPTYPTWLPRTAALAIAALGLAHVGSLRVAANGPVNGFLIGLLATSVLPYLLCLALPKWTKAVGPALGGVFAIALLDAWMYWSVFVAPRGSTAAVGLVFAPLWKLLILLPLGAGVGFAVERLLVRTVTR